jgi:type IV pilus assembly protein PilB
MPDKDFIANQVQTDAHVQAAQATGGTPLTSINQEFEEKSVMERAQKMGMNYIDILSVHINPDHLKVLTGDEANEALTVPFFKVGKKIRLAIAHPTHPGTQAAIRKLKDQGFSINVNLASETGIRKALEQYRKLEALTPIETENIINEEQIASYQEEIENIGALKDKIQSVTAEEALNFINVGALKTGASDIHYQPEETSVTVRFRIDGVLQAVLNLDNGTYKHISNQLKYKSGMKLNIFSIPQDGRYFFTVNQRKVDVRVSSIPTEYGESFVCRLLDSKRKELTFSDLGFEGRNLELLKKALTLPNGMVLVTGPTGSGKTTTLYSLLQELNQPEAKIITLEDPIEYHLAGVTQSQINEKRGYTFGSGLRSILRQDPDVVMLGEIRDSATAQTAAQAALTGHILLSTLHTNSAIETVPRLLNIGLKPFMIAPALSIVIAQRLVRKVCPFCSVQKPITATEKKLLDQTLLGIQKLYPNYEAKTPVALPKGAGCQKCSNSGFLGQISIAEIFENSEELKSAILDGKPTAELEKIAREQGMLSMTEDGLIKVIQGLTTISEVERVTQLSLSHSSIDESANPSETSDNVDPSPDESSPPTPIE